MGCQGYGSLMSSLTLILFRQGHSQSGSSLLPSEKGASFFEGPILSTGISLTEIFHLVVSLFVFLPQRLGFLCLKYSHVLFSQIQMS